MKTFVIIAVLASVCYAASDFVDIPISIFQRNLKNFEFLNFGINKVLELGRTKGRIPNNNFDVTMINSVSQQTSKKTDLYKYNIELDDHKGTTIQANLTVQTQGNVPTLLKAWSYHANTNGYADIGEDYLVSPDDYDDPEIQSAMAYGVQYVLEQDWAKGKIPKDQEYNVTKINSIYAEPSNNQIWYKYDLELENAKGNSQILMNMVVMNDETSHALKVMTWSYSIKTKN